ncbi:hypothetical protein N7520_010582 [Penicillium odoratum]|uniref:uncharacterized protein n=1 Tax=Penicillium odoratum TaxID=1167516 RepID=UPI00254838C9|nr:uncharacterized protein N7520_010582 [Penicillium odoratum]KAJ5745400.1 hypothetical protein N7520_010582 [Penicillium odoratum]
MGEDPVVIERLKAMQMADLGNARRELISTAEIPSDFKFTQVGLDELETSRLSNIPGTAAYKQAERNKNALKAWSDLHRNLDDDGILNSQLDELMNGQTHRVQLQAQMRAAGRNMGPGSVFRFGASQSKQFEFNKFKETAVRQYSGPPQHASRGGANVGKRGHGGFKPPGPTGHGMDPALDINNSGPSFRRAGISKGRKSSSSSRGTRGESSQGAKSPTTRTMKSVKPLTDYSKAMASPEAFLAQVRQTRGPKAAAALEEPEPQALPARGSQLSPHATAAPSKMPVLERSPNPLEKISETAKSITHSAAKFPVMAMSQGEQRELLLDLESPSKPSPNMLASPGIAELTGLEFHKKAEKRPLYPLSKEYISTNDEPTSPTNQVLHSAQMAEKLDNLHKQMAEMMKVISELTLSSTTLPAPVAPQKLDKVSATILATPTHQSFKKYRSPPPTSSSTESKEKFYDATDNNQSPRKYVSTEFDDLQLSESASRKLALADAPVYKIPETKVRSTSQGGPSKKASSSAIVPPEAVNFKVSAKSQLADSMWATAEAKGQSENVKESVQASPTLFLLPPKAKVIGPQPFNLYERQQKLQGLALRDQNVSNPANNAKPRPPQSAVAPKLKQVELAPAPAPTPAPCGVRILGPAPYQPNKK